MSDERAAELQDELDHLPDGYFADLLAVHRRDRASREVAADAGE